MKANRCFRDDEGISNVLGSILIFALLVMFFVVVQVEFVPHWTEEDEAHMQDTLRTQLTTLKGEIDRQAGNRTSSVATTAVTLGERGTGVFSRDTVPGTISFAPDRAPVSVTAEEMRVLRQGVVTTFATGESWEDPVGGTATINNVFEVQHLRLRVINAICWDANSYVQLDITDANGEGGRYRFSVKAGNPSDGFISTVMLDKTDPDSTIYDQGESFFHEPNECNALTEPAADCSDAQSLLASGDAKPWWEDLLAPELHFSDVLAAAATPFTLDLTTNAGGSYSACGQYTISYLETDPGGGSTVLVGNSGVVVSPYIRETGGGSIEVQVPTQELPQQKFVLEGGAVILVQEGEGTMIVPPAFYVDNVGTKTKVILSQIGLTGLSDSFTRKGSVAVTVDGQTSTPVIATAPGMWYRIATDYPGIWCDHFTELFEDSDLAATEYTITQSVAGAADGFCEVQIIGQDATFGTGDPHDLSIELTRATVQVAFQR